MSLSLISSSQTRHPLFPPPKPSKPTFVCTVLSKEEPKMPALGHHTSTLALAAEAVLLLAWAAGHGRLELLAVSALTVWVAPLINPAVVWAIKATTTPPPDNIPSDITPSNTTPPHTDTHPSPKLVYTAWGFLKHCVNSALLLACAPAWPRYDGSNLTRWTRAGPRPWPELALEITFVFILTQWFVDYAAYCAVCAAGPRPPKDFRVMRWHHVVTVGLMGIALVTGFVPIGTEILFLHEVTDIAVSSMQVQKLCKSALLVPSFVLTLGMWFLHRVWSFGALIVRVTMGAPQFTLLYSLGLALLGALWCMHVYWLGLMVSIAARLTTTPAAELAAEYDGRSSGRSGGGSGGNGESPNSN